MSTRKTQPNFHLPEEDFQILVGEGNWKINEVRLRDAAEIQDHFGIDTSFCVFASGLSPVPSESETGDVVVAGIDWVRHEDKRKSGEPELNVYHYMITSKTDAGYPVFYLGSKDTVAPHWTELDELIKLYFKK